MTPKTQKQVRNYVIMFSVIFLLSAFALYFHYADAVLCGKTCRAELAAEASKANQKSATGSLKPITILRSEACERNNCVSTKYLAENYDTSDIKISGGFKEVNGKWERENPQYKESLNMYNTILAKPKNGTLVFVEPDMFTMARSKQIIIEVSLKEYKLKTDRKTEIDFNTDVRTVYNFVWIDSCSIARIGWAENGTANLPKLIQYMANGCQGDLDIKNMTQKIITKKAPRDYCGQECQHQKFMKEAKKMAKNNLLGEHIKIKNSNMEIKKQTTKS